MSIRRMVGARWVFSLLFVPLALFVLAAGAKADGITTAFIYSGGSFTNVVVPGVASPVATGINNSDQVVGTDVNGNIGFLYQKGTSSIITFPGSASTLPRGINDSGTIVGLAYTPGQGSHDFLDKSGSFTTLSLPSGADATGINNAGEIVGYGVGSNEAFFDSNGLITDFKAPGATLTFFDGISNSGEIVGNYFNSSNVENFFVYNPTSGAFEPITIPCGATNFPLSVAGINSKGDIVGDCAGGSGAHNGQEFGYEYDYLTGQFTSIVAPGRAPETVLTGINDSGRIVGFAAPEPSTLAMLLFALVGLFALYELRIRRARAAGTLVEAAK